MMRKLLAWIFLICVVVGLFHRMLMVLTGFLTADCGHAFLYPFSAYWWLFGWEWPLPTAIMETPYSLISAIFGMIVFSLSVVFIIALVAFIFHLIAGEE